jgi:choline dehydrogenase-like flavoprotein
MVLCEQAPDPESRIVLHPHETDALGMPLCEIRWNFDELHLHTLRVAARTFQAAFAQTGFAALRLAAWLQQDEVQGDWRSKLRDWKHHIGTCRMSATPSDGVVDTDCRVFSVANLYVAGSAVFPTGGHANPTFTIVALALRLADHLKRRLA